MIDAPTATIVQRLMAKDPDQRYQSAEDVIRDIQAVQSGKAPADSDAGRQRNRTVGWMIAGVAAGLVLLIAGGWWLYKSGDQVADADSESTLTDGVPMTTVGMENPGLSILPEDDMLNYISFLDLEADCEGDHWRKEDDLIILDDPSKHNRLAVPIRVNQPHDFEVHYRSVEGQGGVDLLIPVGAIGMLKLRVGFNDGNGYELVGLKGSTDSEDYGANSDPNFPLPKNTVHEILVWSNESIVATQCPAEPFTTHDCQSIFSVSICGLPIAVGANSSKSILA